MSKTAHAPRPLIERVAELSMRLAQRHLAAYGATTSRHDFTQRQLLSCLILRAFLKTTYRGVLDTLAASAALRQCLGLEDKLPHYTTLQKFGARSQVVAIVQQLIATIGQSALAAPPGPNKDAAMDSTGLAHTGASDYFRHRSGSKIKGWVKVSVMVLCGSLLPLALVVDAKPGNDRVHAEALITQAQQVAKPERLYADAGYDSEPLHQRCREQGGVESVIPPIQRRADGQRGGKWRTRMTPEYLQPAQYQRRWTVESFSGLQRTMGSTLSARQPDQKLAEAALRVLAYAIRR